VDRLPRYVKGNRFLVYQYLYRNTLGRQRPHGFFVSGAVAVELGLSEKTVRNCWEFLERVGLVELDEVRGSHKGKRIRLVELEGVLQRLDDSAEHAQAKHEAEAHNRRGEAPPSSVKVTDEGASSSVKVTDEEARLLPMRPSVIGKSYRDSSASLTDEGASSSVRVTDDMIIKDMVERHGKTPPPPRPTLAAHGGGGERADFERLLCEGYGFAPDRASSALATLGDEDLDLLPILLQRLDAEIHQRRVRNPAGLLATRLRTFDLWKPLLEAARDADSPRPKSEQDPVSLAELQVVYMRTIDVEARAKLAAMSEADREILAEEVRQQAYDRSPAARKWTEAEWRENLEPLLVAAIRAEAISFDAWLERVRAHTS
jgi:hypothetical protein